MDHEHRWPSPAPAGPPAWVEQPRGTLRRPEFRQIASRLEGVPTGTTEVWIDCRQVSHLDYRIGGEIRLLLRRLRSRGVGLRFVGIDPYLRSILRLSLAEEEPGRAASAPPDASATQSLRNTEIAEGSESASAGTGGAAIERFVRRLASESVSRN